MSYPPYTITSTALKLVAAISEQLATLSASDVLSQFLIFHNNYKQINNFAAACCKNTIRWSIHVVFYPTKAGFLQDEAC